MKLTGFPLLAPALAIVSAVMLTAPAAAQRSTTSLEEFQLPPSPRQTPEVQGPIADGIPLPRTPRPSPSAAPVATPAPTALPTQAPTPTAPTPTASTQAPPPTSAASAPPAATSQPAVPDSMAAPRNSGSGEASTNVQTVPQARPASPANIAAPDSPAPAISAVPPTLPDFDSSSDPAVAASPAPAQTSAAKPAPSDSGNSHWWAWLIAGFILAWLSGGLFWLYRQRHESGGRMIAPTIERPRPKSDAADQSAKLPATAAAPDKEPAPAPPEPETIFPANCALRCTLETTRLSLSLMNVTLAYRLTLANDSGAPIRDIIIGGDLVTAHASVPIDQQIAEPGQSLQRQHHVPLLLPDQNAQFSGEFRLPIPAIHALRRKDSVMFVPLLRLRIDAQDMDQIALQTLVIGQSPAGPGAGLRPFRLDLGPRIYGDIGHRLLAPLT